MSKELSQAVKAMLAKSNVAQVTSMESGSGGVPRISLKKSKFTAKNGDEELKLGESIQVVILDVAPMIGFNKTYYAEGYKPGSADAPDCSSDDGLRPNSFASSPQNDKCVTCKMNQWGSAVSMSGGKAKACKDSKRLYVKLAEELNDDKAPVYLLNVTVMSLKPFGAYGKALAADGIPSPALVITELGFDEDASVPKLTFKNLGIMGDKEVEAALGLAEAKAWDTKITLPASADKQKLEGPKVVEGESTNDSVDPTANW